MCATDISSWHLLPLQSSGSERRCQETEGQWLPFPTCFPLTLHLLGNVPWGPVFLGRSLEFHWQRQNADSKLSLLFTFSLNENLFKRESVSHRDFRLTQLTLSQLCCAWVCGGGGDGGGRNRTQDPEHARCLLYSPHAFAEQTQHRNKNEWWCMVSTVYLQWQQETPLLLGWNPGNTFSATKGTSWSHQFLWCEVW